MHGGGKLFSAVKQLDEVCLKIFKGMFWGKLEKIRYLQRIGNNVEAFRYYLALKSGQFQPNKIMRK